MWIKPERIAEVMLAVVQGEEYVGGTVLEVGLETVRRVEGLGDPGPDSEFFPWTESLSLVLVREC